MTRKKNSGSQKKQSKAFTTSPEKNKKQRYENSGKKQIRKKQTKRIKQTKGTKQSMGRQDKKTIQTKNPSKMQTFQMKASYHDLLFKMCLENIQCTKEFFSLALPKKILDLFNWEKLQEEKDSFPNKRADLVFSVPYKDLKNPSKELKNESRVFFLIEHKSKYDPNTFFQIFTYKNKLMEKSYKQKKKARSVISILFYHGKTPWNPKKTFHSEMFEDFMEKLPLDLRENHGVFILDIHDPKVKAAIQNPDCKIRGFLKLFLDGRNLESNEALLYECVSLFKSWEGDREESALVVWSYIRSVNPGISEELLKKVERRAIKNGIFPEGGNMNVRDLIRQEGIQEGREEGIQRIQQIVSNMFQNNLDVSFISKVTGLSKKEIKKLKKGN